MSTYSATRTHRPPTFKVAPSSTPPHVIHGCQGRFSIVLPQESTNQILNPSIEEAFFSGLVGTQYDPIGVMTLTIDRVTNRRNHVALQVSGNDASGGVSTDVTVEGGYNSFSVDILGPKGSTFEIGYQLTNGTVLHSSTHVMTGFWQRVSDTYYAPQQETLARVFVRKTTPFVTSSDFWVDGFQHEYSEEPTSFISGSEGLDWCGPDCFRTCDGRTGLYNWEGEQFNSISTRHALTRHGGTCVDLYELGFRITGMSGLGMPTPEDVTQNFASQDGSNWQTQCYTEGQIILSGFFAPCDDTVHCQRQELVRAIAQESRNYRQPMILKYQETDCITGCKIGREMAICVTYGGGLEMSITDCNRELAVELVFNARSVYWSEEGYQTRGRRVFNADNDTEFCMLVGNRGTAPTSPLFQFVGGSYDIVSICNFLTGDKIEFDPPLNIADRDALLNINTDPTNTFGRLIEAGTVTNVLGNMTPGSAVSSFELLPERVNPICITLTNVGVIPPDPANPLEAQIRVLSKVQFYGVDAAACSGPLDNVYNF